MSHVVLREEHPKQKEQKLEDPEGHGWSRAWETVVDAQDGDFDFTFVGRKDIEGLEQKNDVT